MIHWNWFQADATWWLSWYLPVQDLLISAACPFNNIDPSHARWKSTSKKKFTFLMKEILEILKVWQRTWNFDTPPDNPQASLPPEQQKVCQKWWPSHKEFRTKQATVLLLLFYCLKFSWAGVSHINSSNVKWFIQNTVIRKLKLYRGYKKKISLK